VNRRDSEALVDLLRPDVEFFPILAALEGPVYAGLPGVRRWLRSLELDWEIYETRLERVYDLGDSALGVGRWHARGRTSGVELHMQPGAWHARVLDGRVAWWRTYTDRAEALRSVWDGTHAARSPSSARRSTIWPIPCSGST
jgi:ketosteroid isomerase-like protein